jgi:hypothetical protein
MRIRKDCDRVKSMSERLREMRAEQATVRGEWDGWNGQITPENSAPIESHDDAADYAGLPAVEVK